jgi:hypothetical protein
MAADVSFVFSVVSVSWVVLYGTLIEAVSEQNARENI